MQSAHPDSGPGAIDVIVVEDDLAFRDALCHAVEAAPDLRLRGVAGTLADALALLQGPPAEVLLVDLGLPDGSGIELIGATAARWPRCNIMVATQFGDEAHVIRSIEAGAAGYLLKDSSPARMVDEIRCLAGGGSPISPIIARQILTRFQQNRPAPRAAAAAPPSPLSARETEVLDFITKGFTTLEISKLMVLSHFTVRSFVRRIYHKLEVTSKAEAIYEARSLGLLRDH
ncbi:response regulator transcription factor [Burkholderia plantarii]|uniref:Putative two component response regulator transcription regulator protein n=1 Tax=Burkholderia plantarii TaxID=41899 RepID=A0A0B6RZD0_BURPL|nr:response regulator transcription factor [Burkholderia plantarii]AJK48753.1 putative two component response regulator transcription regulator protein [Burkholderia plantarii]